jgi:DNA-directed RNA polymerase subunit RPC12/RpoP
VIIKCADCKGKVSVSAISCPHCGNTKFKEQYILAKELKSTKTRFNFQFSKKQILYALWLFIFTLAGIRFTIIQYLLYSEFSTRRLYSNNMGLLTIDIVTFLILIFSYSNFSNRLIKRREIPQYEAFLMMLFLAPLIFFTVKSIISGLIYLFQ